MKHDPEKLKVANERLAELLAIEVRADLTEAQKSALISAKMDEYEQHPYVPRVEPRPPHSGQTHPPGGTGEDDEMEALRRDLRRALKEGRIRVTPLSEE